MSRDRDLESTKAFLFMEIFKDVVGYEGIYKVSNMGRVKSLSNLKGKKEKLLKPSSNDRYARVVLFNKKERKTKYVHVLVAEAFLGHTPCGMDLVVDHINGNTFDNRIENLQIVTHRFNVYKIKSNFTSNYKGVSWYSQRKKWRALIKINGESFYLGLYDNEEDAHNAYQNELIKRK